MACQIADFLEVVHQLEDVTQHDRERWSAFDVGRRTFGYLWPRTATVGLKQTIAEQLALVAERPEVFEATQSFALRLAAAGDVQGLRIDHPDGLYDPAGYFEQLQAGYVRRAGLVLPGREADGRPARPLYVVAEKIAAPHEEVPEEARPPVQWEVAELDEEGNVVKPVPVSHDEL